MEIAPSRSDPSSGPSPSNPSQPNITGTLVTLFSLLFGFGLLQVGNTLQGTLLTVRGGLEHFSVTQIGLIGSGFSAGLVLGSLRADRLIHAVGHNRAFAALASVASAIALLHLMIIDPIAWAVFRFMTGFCFAGLLMAVESWLNSAATTTIRGQILGFYGMTGLCAGVIGQMLLPVADPQDFMLFCIASVILSLALVPVAVSRSTAPNHGEEHAALNLPKLYRQSPFGLVAAFLCGISTGAIYALGPYFAQQLGFSEVGIAIFMASITLGAFVTTWPVGWLSDRIDRRIVVIGLALVSSLALAGLVLVLPPEFQPPPVVDALIFLAGGMVLPTYSVVVAHVNDLVSPKEFIAASGGLLIVQGAGMATGPVLGGVVMSALGVDGLLWLIVSAQLLVAVWGIYRLTRRASPEVKEHFQAMPVAPVGTQLIEASHQAS